MKFFNAQRGYVRHIVTPGRWQADYQALDKVSVPDGSMSTRKTFVIEKWQEQSSPRVISGIILASSLTDTSPNGALTYKNGN